MKSVTLNKGDVLSGFRVLDVVPIEEMDAAGVYAVHEKSGCELFHVCCDDAENLFAFAFATPPGNSKGTAHIIEHSVLCGSERFPLKDPFVVLAGQSVKTFLNAMTYYDKTVYPASSISRADYFNLMAVYGDAVFFPLLEEWTFLQEGRRFEVQADGNLAVQGVVFNEMKGNYSSFDAVAADWTVRSLFEGTAYGFDSGGEPECIPDLTFEEFKAFHKKHYHPSNCRVFLYGDIPTEEQMAFLDESFLSRFERAERPPVPPAPERWSKPKTVRRPAPAGDASCDEGKASVSLNWLLPESADVESFMLASLIEEILVGHDGSPLSRALLESGLGDDILPSNGLETSMRFMGFSAGLRNVKEEDAAAVESLILKTLRDLAEGGIPEADVKTAIRAIDFSNREIKRSSGPFSLVVMVRALRGWMFGRRPIDSLRVIPAFESLKEKIGQNQSLLSDFIRERFLENSHRCLLSVYPDKEWNARADALLKEKCAEFAKEARLDDEQRRKAYLEAQEAFFEKQRVPDSAESLALIPHLLPAELPNEPEEPPFSLKCFGEGAVMMVHTLNTNGISYADFFFPVDTLAVEDYALLPFFSIAYSNVGLSLPDGSKMSWAESSARSAELFGGAAFSLYTSSIVEGAVLPQPFKADDAGRDFIVFRVKMLEELTEEAFDFALNIIQHADFSDEKRTSQLFSEYRNDMEASIAPAGHQYAASRASAGASRAKAIDELWNGFAQIRFLRSLAENKERLRELPSRLAALKERISKSGVFVHLTGTESGIKRLTSCVSSKMAGFSGLAPASRKTAADDAFFESVSALQLGERCFERVFSEMQVGFAATAFRAPPYPSLMHSALTVLGHWLSTGPLWEKVRTAGGAYGAFAYPDSLENVFIFSSYRDPDPIRSLSAFLESIGEAAVSSLSKEETDRMITGTFSKELEPKSPSSSAFIACARFLYGITPETRKQKLELMKALTPENLKEAAAFIAKGIGKHAEAAVGTRALVKERKETCGETRIFEL